MATNDPEWIEDCVAEYVGELGGKRSEDAWHALIELGPAGLPHLIRAFEAARDRRVAVELITIVNELRTPSALPFLTERLRSGETAIWQAALDGIVQLGIVTVGGGAAAECLRTLRPTLDAEKQRWIDEALEQIEAGGA